MLQRDGRGIQAATGTEMNVFSESFEDVQPKASVAANTGSGLDLPGLHTLPQLFPTKVLKMTTSPTISARSTADGPTRPPPPASRATTGSAFPSRPSAVTSPIGSR